MFDRPLLANNQVKLCTPVESDLPVVAAWHQDELFLRMTTDGAAVPHTEDAIRQWYLTDDPLSMVFGVRLAEQDRLVGFLALTVISWPHRNAQIKLGVGPSYWKQNFGSDALQLATAFSFRELNLHRLQATLFSYNERAIHTYQQQGFVQEGICREYLRRDGKWHDLLMLGLLARDWRKKPNP